MNRCYVLDAVRAELGDAAADALAASMAQQDEPAAIEGFSHFVTSMTAPIASGWSGCRMGFAPTGKRRLCTAHTRNGHWVSRSGRDRHFASRIHHGAHSTGEWPIFHGASGRAFNERGESGIRNILKPAISGNRSAASADTKVRTAAGTSPLISRSIAFV
jgi:hypothetical protein